MPDPPRPLRLALLQMAPCGTDLAANLAKADAHCRVAASLGADIALFPEMWSNGYTLPPHPATDEQVAAWAADALAPDDPWVLHFRDLARELRLAIACTYLERTERGPRNTVTLFDRRGERVLDYSKVHTCAFDAECVLTPGDGFPVADLSTAVGNVRVGAMICFDREHPESARVMMLQGAELILTPNCCDLEINRLSQFRARAFENALAVAMANHAAPKCNGHSVAYDGMACTAQGESRDMLLVEAGAGEGVYVADLDLAALREYREREPWGARWRRVGAYGGLTR